MPTARAAAEPELDGSLEPSQTPSSDPATPSARERAASAEAYQPVRTLIYPSPHADPRASNRQFSFRLACPLPSNPSPTLVPLSPVRADGSPSLLRSDEFQPLSSPVGTRAVGSSLPVTS